MERAFIIIIILKQESYFKTNQMQFDKGSFESYNIATNAGLKQSNFLTWAGIRSAIPSHLKFLDDNSRKTGSLEFCCGEKVFDLGATLKAGIRNPESGNRN